MTNESASEDARYSNPPEFHGVEGTPGMSESEVPPMEDERPCRVCGEIVPVDGENAIERWGGVLCRDCSDEPVVFKATCTSELCDWSFRTEDDEFNRGYVKTRAQQEANHHQKSKEVFEDNPMHRTTVEEVNAGP